MSVNPITRTVFQRPAASFARAVHEKLADTKVPALQPFSTQGRVTRAGVKEIRTTVAGVGGRVAAANEAAAGEYANALRELKSSVGKDLVSRPHEMTAVAWHNAYPELSVETAQTIVDSMTKNIAELKTRPGSRVRTSVRESNVNALQALIDEHPDLLAFDTAPPRVQRAIAAVRVIPMDNIAKKAYGLDTPTLRARAELPQRVQ